jgi:hypothetical protein
MSHKKSPHRTGIAVLVLIGIATLTAIAANVHFKGQPEFTDNGTTLTTNLCLAGLGNKDVTIQVTASGQATVTCTNKAGHQAPGLNKEPITTAGAITIPQEEIKNGNVCIAVTTEEPTLSSKSKGCPPGQTASVSDVEFNNAVITVRQGGKVVLQQSFTP